MPLSAEQLLALKLLPGVGKTTIFKALQSFSDTVHDSAFCTEICATGIKYKNESGQKVIISPDIILKYLDKANYILQKTKEKGIGYITCYEWNFPKILDKDGKKQLPPLILYYKGNISLLSERIITIIGSRAALPEAENAGVYLAKKLAERGVVILSGLALGCDSSAHMGALSAPNGKTIAVVGNGLDIFYPSQNKNLYNEIISQNGLIISEYEIGTKATSYQLVARDYLQAAFGASTIVLQTAVDGGSRHAALATYYLKKPLYTVFYSKPQINQNESVLGNHDLAENYNASYIYGLNSEDMEKQIDNIIKQSF